MWAKTVSELHGLTLVLLVVTCSALGAPARAVPSFAQQTGQPCAACHVGAFGPQLKPFGRDFKLYGYQSADGKSKELPIALMAQASVTHTGADQSPPPAPHFGDNDNFAIDQLSVFYAGKAAAGFGAFAQATYDGVARTFHLDNVDVRRVKEVTILGRDSLVGLDFNNNPTVQDVWNSTPAWGFPYNSSALGAGAPPQAQIEGALGQKVVGAGVYGLWDDTLYVEGNFYHELDRRFVGRLGTGSSITDDRYTGVMPYGRVALLHDFGSASTVQAGLFAMQFQAYPSGIVASGQDHYADLGVDANYQYIGDDRNVISAHAVSISERRRLDGTAALNPGMTARSYLSTSRADVSYSRDNTWTPTLQVFSVRGAPDPTLAPTAAKSSGVLAEIAFTPWGKPNSPVYWANARFAVQYIAYSELNGQRSHASDNNTLYLNVWMAMAPFGSRVVR